ncbi:MAG: ATP-dependent zinc metalloprotease FtsH [bacterium]|nr:ATP-dependent zinc metalloprotease FtsH [bacterium]
MKSSRWNSLSVIAILLALAFLYTFWTSSAKVEEIKFSKFLQSIEGMTGTGYSQINKVEIREDEGIIMGEAAAGQTEIPAQFRTRYPVDYTARIIDLLASQNIEIDVKSPPFILTALSPLLLLLVPLGLFGLLYFFLYRQAQSAGGQAFSFGKSRAKMLTDNRPQVKFKDVAGVDEATEELSEVVEFLKERKKFIALGARIPKGVLLVGPPGCGKTLLARAIAGEAGVPFFHMSGSDFVEMFVGVGASRVRDLFDQAKKNAPSIVFVDEIDAVGRQRGAGLGGGHDEREQTLNALLVEMDGFDPNAGVIMIAATNRPDILDPALLRPGRFDRHIVVDRPDIKGREEILVIHTREIPLADGVDLGIIARRTPGFTGSDLRNLCNEAAILAARKNEKKVRMDHFEESIERVVAGPQRRSRVISEVEQERLAYHEAGHALVPYYVGGQDPVHKISILPRGMALGYTLQLPLEDRYLTTEKEIVDKLKTALGGRVAEEIMFSEVSTGASDDLNKVTDLARRMVTEFGMSKKLGPVTFGRKHSQVFLGRDIYEDRNYSEKTAQVIDSEVQRIVHNSHSEVTAIITAHKDKLVKVATRLLEIQDMDGKELIAILEDQPNLIDADTPLLDLAKKSMEHLEDDKKLKISDAESLPPRKSPPAIEPA